MAPPFDINGSEYDMSSFWGRTRYWAGAISPMLLLENKQSLAKHQRLLDDWAHNKAPYATDAELWKAKRAVENCVHRTTGDVIFPPFRMSNFLPLNFFIVPFMMAPSTVASVPRTVFIQWFNQSYNSAVNYANRSSDKQPTSEILKAYTAAVVVACGGSLGATYMVSKVPPNTTRATVIRGTVPFLAVCAAAMVNLAFMRKNEWMSSGQGIQVVDEDGTARGSSTAAGRQSLYKCSVTRVLWNLPSMVLPTLLMVPLTRRFRTARTHAVKLESLAQIVGLTVGVPPALAVYDVQQQIAASQLEPQYQHLHRRDGTPVRTFTYYKGL